MQITARNLGKRYIREWVFRGFDYEFNAGEIYAVTGPNGSGKSTLLQVIGGIIPFTSGDLSFENEKSPIDTDDVYRHISLCAPYVELIEEFTLKEFLKFHFTFKSLKEGMKFEDVIHRSGLEGAEEKEIRNFSSGMKQRLRLGTTLFVDSPVLLLDEPTSNLDEKGKEWYSKEMDGDFSDRIVVIASNVKAEYEMCSREITVTDYRK